MIRASGSVNDRCAFPATTATGGHEPRVVRQVIPYLGAVHEDGLSWPVGVRCLCRHLLEGGVLVRTWPRGSRRAGCTDTADYPPEKIAFLSRNPVWCRSQATGLGPHVAELVEGLLAVQALHRLRSAQGIIGLAGKHGAQRVDLACQLALAAGDPTYRTVRGILAAGTETTASTADPGSPGSPGAASVGPPAHLHGPDGLLAHLADSNDDDNDNDTGAPGTGTDGGSSAWAVGQ